VNITVIIRLRKTASSSKQELKEILRLVILLRIPRSTNCFCFTCISEVKILATIVRVTGWIYLTGSFLLLLVTMEPPTNREEDEGCVVAANLRIAGGNEDINRPMAGGFVELLLGVNVLEREDGDDIAVDNESSDEEMPWEYEAQLLESANKILRQTPANSIDVWVLFRRRHRYRRLRLLDRVVACTLAIQIRQAEKESLRIRIPSVCFSINRLSEKDCVDRFRFRKPQLCYMLMKLKLPPFFSTKERYRVSGIEALCITLERLSYPSRWRDLVVKYGRSDSNLSSIFYYVCEHISTRCAPLLSGDWDRISARLENFTAAIRAKGAALFNVWGFIDGTLRRTCRPSDGLEQRALFSGHKRCHGIKYQAVTTPDGIISRLFGPVEGRLHDLTLLDASELEESIRADSRFKGYLLYGDPAYGMTEVFASPFNRIGATKEEAAVNASMSRVRISVEWGFGSIINDWAMVDFKPKMTIGSVPVGMLFEVSTIFTNCITIASRQNVISSYFDVVPPSFDKYFECLA
ncbi:hypothetical protein F443_03109, partial [Phytophthora nicotianae P1569]